MEEDILLKLENVEICREENRVLHDACLTLRNGEFVYVIGKVGSGKSSLLKSLYCEIPILRGEARIMDYNLTKMKRKDIPYLRRKLGIVFQDFQLLTDRSVSKNLEFVLKATGWKKKSEIKERIDNVLRQVGMQDKGYKMPHELSGGEQQRIVIARALLNNPKLILADEPTGNLDPEISDYLYKKNPDGANEIINKLAMKYMGHVEELYSTEEYKQKAKELIKSHFEYIRTFTKDLFTLFEEKVVLAQGELISTGMMNLYLNECGVKSVLIPALDYMRTDKNAEPDPVYIKEKLVKLLADNKDADLYITQGYICRNAYGEIDNLQRGGSDYSASLIGAAIGAEEIQIWTDIDGMHNNDPRIVQGTSPVRQLHFEEAAELAYFGAKILHPTCILPAKLNNIPVRLLNTMQPDAPGTLISNAIEKGKIKAVAAKDNITSIKIKSGRMLLATGFLRKVFETFENYQTPIDMVTTSEVGVSVTIDNRKHLEEIVDDLKKYGTVTVDEDMVIVCVVGDLEWDNIGFEARIVQAMKDVPVRMISYGGSNYNVSLLIKASDKQRALQALSDHLFNNK